MDQSEKIALANHVLQVLCRSLPMYLKDAKPWRRRDQQSAQAAIDHLVADQELYASRMAHLILEEDGRPDPGRFPSEFAAINDLGIDYLLQEVLRRQRGEVATLRRAATDLAAHAPMHLLAEEILGNAQGHLEVLEGLGIGGLGIRD